MNVQFDKRLKWLPVPATLAQGNNRLYLAAPPPYRLVLVCHAEAVQDFFLYNEFGNPARPIFDCSVGDHDGHTYPDFCLPQFAGLTHTKITLRRFVLDGATPQDNLSGILEGVPTGGQEEARRPKRHMKPVALPSVLHDALFEQAVIENGHYDGTADDLVANIILDYFYQRQADNRPVSDREVPA